MKQTTVTLLAAIVTALAALAGASVGAYWTSKSNISATSLEIQHETQTHFQKQRIELLDRVIKFHIERSSADPSFEVEGLRNNYIKYVHKNVESASRDDLELQREFVEMNSESYAKMRELTKEYSIILAHTRIYFSDITVNKMLAYGEEPTNSESWSAALQSMLLDIERYNVNQTGDDNSE